MATNQHKWDWEINRKTNFWSHSAYELWAYRHLLQGLIKRFFILNYKQTAIGPLWILFMPIMTLVTYIIVFNKLIGITTGGLPPVIFYGSGIILWNFFSDSFTGTASTFRENSQLFSKVYFPRIIIPFSVVSTHLLRFLLLMLMFLLIISYFLVFTDFHIELSLWTFALPIAIVFIGLFGLGIGLVFSVYTAKYRDLTNFVSIGVRLLMYITPVIYPMVAIPKELRWVVLLNPLTSLFELFRLSLLGSGELELTQLAYSISVIMLILIGATMLFNKQSDKLIDVV